MGHSTAGQGTSQAPNTEKACRGRSCLWEVSAVHSQVLVKCPWFPQQVTETIRETRLDITQRSFPSTGPPILCHWRGNHLPFPCSKFRRRAGNMCARACIWQSQHGNKNGKEKLRRRDLLILLHKFNTSPSPAKYFLK